MKVLARAIALIGLLGPTAGCVMTGSEGMVANQIDYSAGSAAEHRAAMGTVTVLTVVPTDMAAAGTVTARRCHKNFTEAEPTEAAITEDLQIAAYAKGGDALVVTGMKKLNGLAADCWYVLEGTASIFKRTS